MTVFDRRFVQLHATCQQVFQVLACALFHQRDHRRGTLHMMEGRLESTPAWSSFVLLACRLLRDVLGRLLGMFFCRMFCALLRMLFKSTAALVRQPLHLVLYQFLCHSR